MNLLGLSEASASLRVSISGLMGSTSLACWIVLLMPQLIEQWRLKSAEGIAIGFISIWFLGDITNLVGALWAGLLPEVVFLAVWFCIADFMMIGSYFYYTRIYKKRKDHTHHHLSAAEEETSYLLQRRHSEASTHSVVELNKIFTNYILPIFFVLGSGFLGFMLSGSEEPEDPASHPIKVGPQIMGYISAALYLGARIPQIIQNHRRKSVYGLSLLFFLFSVLGNLTYAGQILFYRSDSQYILLNLSWLLGSLGTIFEDSFIFLQFYMYKDNGKVISG